MTKYLILIVIITLLKNSDQYYGNRHKELSDFKREFLGITDKLNNNEDESNENQISNAKNLDFYKFLANLLKDDADDFDHSLFYQSNLNSKNKRFIKSLFDLLKPNKNKTTYPNTFDDFESEFFSKFSTKGSTSYSSKVIAQTSTKGSHSITDDPFYKLKQHCKINFDKLCSSKKIELYDLVKKCNQLENKNKPIAACRDVLSIFCYVYYDSKTCFGEDYDPYIPGRKSYSLTTKTISTASSRRIPIIIESTTTKPSTTTKFTTTQSTTTTKKITSTFISSSSKKLSLNNDLISPFDGPVTSIPNDAEKLKKIGNYCLKSKQKDDNCDKMLALLKEKFKSCEKKLKTDSDCQIFKIQFCSAFSTFPCCPDVLAGRTCSGKNNNLRRSYLNM